MDELLDVLMLMKKRGVQVPPLGPAAEKRRRTKTAAYLGTAVADGGPALNVDAEILSALF